MTWAPDHLLGEPQRPEPARPRPSATAAIARGGLADYAAASPLQVLRGLDSTPRGLEESVAQARLARHGDNAIAADGQPGWGARSLAAARNPFVVILIGLTAVSAVTGDLRGAAVIAVMVLISCVLRVS